MSQLFINFRSKSRDEELQDDPRKMYLGFPIVVVPVKYWAIEKTEINIVTKKIMELVRESTQSIDDICEVLGVPSSLKKVIGYEWTTLEQKGILYKERETWKVKAEEDALVNESYKDGYLIYDRIRGLFFPYTHEGSYYLTSEKKIKASIVPLSPNVNLTRKLYESDQTLASARKAARLYGMAKKDEIYSDELTFDLPEDRLEHEASFGENSNLDLTHYRIEMKPYSFVQEGYMIVTLQGDVSFRSDGTPKPYIKTLSPFNNFESKTFYSAIDSKEEGHHAIEMFNELLLEVDHRSFEQAFLLENGVEPDRDLYEKLYENLSNELGQVKVSNSVMELLEAVEKEFIKLTLGIEEFVGNRSSILNNWNLVIEALLDEFIKKQGYDSINALPQWDKIGSTEDSEIYLKNRLLTSWSTIPIPMKSNIKQKLKFIKGHQVISRTRINGNRDRVACILLCELSLKENGKQRTPLLQILDTDSNFLISLDHICQVRNEMGGHYDDQLVLISQKDFTKLLESLRQHVYNVIKLLNSKELIENGKD